MKHCFAIILVGACLGAGPATRPSTQPAAGKVVFLLDASGGMLPQWGWVDRQVLSMVRGLERAQFANVLICRNQQVTGAFGQLAAMNEDAKADVVAFLEPIRTGGEDTQVKGLAAAIKQGASEIWFFSDGQFNEWRQLQEIAARAKGVKIMTVCAGASGENENEMAMLAFSTGGTCFDSHWNVIKSRPPKRVNPGVELK